MPVVDEKENQSFFWRKTILDPNYALFAAIADAGSLAAAARRLNLSPPMVSKRLARLEARLGVQLVMRTTRRMELTAPGHRFHADISNILGLLEMAEQTVAGPSSSPSGSLRISAPTSFGRMHIAPHLRAFLDAYPAVDLALHLSDDYVDLADRRIDLAIRITADPGPGITARRLATNRRLLCAAPAYLARHGKPATTGDLSHHHLLAAEGQLPWRLEGPHGPVRIDGRSIVTTNSSEVVRELAIAGVGIALRSLWDVGTALKEGTLVPVLPEHPGYSDVGIYAVTPGARTPPSAATAFITFLESLYQPHAPWDLPCP